jgi:hypothetical protein
VATLLSSKKSSHPSALRKIAPANPLKKKFDYDHFAIF